MAGPLSTDWWVFEVAGFGTAAMADRTARSAMDRAVVLNDDGKVDRQPLGIIGSPSCQTIAVMHGLRGGTSSRLSIWLIREALKPNARAMSAWPYPIS